MWLPPRHLTKAVVYVVGFMVFGGLVVALLAVAAVAGFAAWRDSDEIVLTIQEARIVFGFLLALLPLLIITDSLNVRDKQIEELRTLNESVARVRSTRREIAAIERDFEVGRRRVAAGLPFEKSAEFVEPQESIDYFEERLAVVKEARDAQERNLKSRRKDALEGSAQYLWVLLVSGIALMTSLFGVLAPTSAGLTVAFTLAVTATASMVFGFLNRFADALPFWRSFFWGAAGILLVLVSGAVAVGLSHHVIVK